MSAPPEPPGDEGTRDGRAEVSPRERAADRILAAALELIPADVPAFLDQRCAGDPELRRLVEELLVACTSPDSLLHTHGLTGPAAPPLAPGERVGAWELVREIGRGGMGVVYLAERADGQFSQRGALKVMHGPAAPDLVARFEQERQILATLEHPGIARLIDGGVASDGRPFLVLEHVEGATLLEHCNRQRLSLRPRLQLFLEVCEAVAAAHRAMIIHRDLKPANVLVTSEGRIKLLDFGIAKLATPGTEPTLTMGAAVRLLTPEYASPEQLRGEAITSASDIYQLGALLYELLTGFRPYRLEVRAPALWGEILAREAPLPPSRVVLERVLPEMAAARGFGSLARWSRELRGDLDTIVLQALRDRPSRRHPSVDHLAEDVRCFLQGRPVSARRENTLYVAGKLLGRHRLASMVAATALVAIAGTTLVHTRALTEERDRARLEAQRSASVRDFLVELFEATDPAVAGGEELAAADLLERGIERIEGALEADPEGRAELLQVMGRVSRSLGRYDTAAELLERALELRRRLGDSLEAARPMVLLAEIRSLQGRGPEAELLFQEALEIRHRHLGDDHPDVAATLDALAVALHYQGRLEEADPLYRRALEIRSEALGEDHEDTLATTNNLANLQRARGNYVLAQEMHRRVLAVRQVRHGEIHPQVSLSLGNLAAALRAGGNYAEAAELQRRTLAIDLELKGEDHPDVATNRNNLAVALRDLGELAEAEEQFRLALESDRRALGDDHPWVAMALDNLASVLVERGALEEAHSLLQEAEQIYRRAGRRSGGVWATHLGVRARLAEREGSFEVALATLEEALAARAGAPGDPALAAAVDRRKGNAREALGDLEGAEADYRRALAGLRESLPERHPEIAHALLDLGGLLLLTGRRAEALPLVQEAAEIREHTYPAGGWRRAESQIAWLAANCGLAPGADALTAALAPMSEVLGPDHPALERSRRLLAICGSAAPISVS